LIVFYIRDFELLAELWNLVGGVGRESSGAEDTAAVGGREGGRRERIRTEEKRRFKC